VNAELRYLSGEIALAKTRLGGQQMAQPKKDLSADDAQKEAFAALDKDTTTKVTIERQDDGKWTVTVQP
jgi:hypothetical protein